MADIAPDNPLMSLTVEGQEDGSLLMQTINVSEGISRPYMLRIDLVAASNSLDFTQIIGKKACVSLISPDKDKPRYFNGYVSRFVQTGADLLYNHYQMDVVPWIWFLNFQVDCRVFHNMTIPDIVNQVLNDSPTTQKDTVQSNVQSGNYTKLEYCVQYRESSLNFVSRLMEHAGIYYYFQFDEKTHTMVLCDASSSAPPCPVSSTASFLIKGTGELEEGNIVSLYSKREFRAGKYTHTDYNFKTPSSSLVTSENTVIEVGGNTPLEVFDYPGTHLTSDDGRKIAKIRMEEQEATHQLIAGSGSFRTLASGYTFTLKDHNRTDMNVEYLLTEVNHLISSSGASYSNQFSCIPASIPYRPRRVSPKPIVYGPQTAIVVGKSQNANTSDDDPSSDGEEIWVDKYGRVMVLFPWDRANGYSCWARVSQEWAGEGYGAMFIPRVGQEVIVSFLNGDPNYPIVTGRVYNAEQTVPYPLPENQTRSTFMTRSSKGGSSSTYNELRFEDKTSSEQVFIRSQRDFDLQVLNDSRENVGSNYSLIVGKDQSEKVGGDRNEQVTGKHVEKVGGDWNSDVTGNINQKAGQNISIQAGQNLYEKSGQIFAHEAGQVIHLKAGMSIVIEAGEELTLKAGSSFIDIGPSGIAISGTPMVMINSGGAAGSGPGSSPTDPAAPKDPDQADDGSKGTKLNG